jgi:hypothetical protein
VSPRNKTVFELNPGEVRVVGLLLDARDREQRGETRPGVPTFAEWVQVLSQKDPPFDVGPLNWLKFAVYILGGVEKTAEIMNVTTATVYAWLQRGKLGVRRLQYYQVEKLAELTGIRIDLIGAWGRENEPTTAKTKGKHTQSKARRLKH